MEQNEKRCEVLKQFAESSGATCIKVINKDVLTVNKDECPNVDYILLDPSCSGSGKILFHSMKCFFVIILIKYFYRNAENGTK